MRDLDKSTVINLPPIRARAVIVSAPPLTLADVLAEILLAKHHLPFTQQDLERLRQLFDLPPRDLPESGNVVRFFTRARVAHEPEGKPAA